MFLTREVKCELSEGVRTPPEFDLVSLGEPLLRLSPPGFGQLRRASSFDVQVAGAQYNMAADLANLGRRTALVTKLPDNPLGMLVVDTCRSNGIDTRYVRLVPGARMGVTYVEFSVAPRAPLSVFDRAGSAASSISPDDFDWDEILAKTSHVYTDGIFPGLSSSCCEAAVFFFDAAKRKGRVTCFDVNYRAHLWTPNAAHVAWSRVLANVDILVTNQGVSELVFGFAGSDEDIMRRYAGEFGCKVVCLTSREIHGLQKGAWKSLALVRGEVVHGRRFEFDIVDRYGTGDAWFAGFLHAYMETGGENIEYALNFANGLCALSHTTFGDVAHFMPQDVKAILGNETDLRVKR